jgi:F420-dependent methylenetetrahydromethanopterin dehydrogenase
VFNLRHSLVIKSNPIAHADVIDLLLDADETTRKQVMLQVLQSGAVRKSEAEELMAQVLRLERVAGPRSSPTTVAMPEQQPEAAWGIDYP